MKTRFRILQCITLLIIIGVSASIASARMMPQVRIESGTVSSVTNNEIRLENGNRFQPASGVQGISVQKGDSVTLRYYVSPSGENIFLEYAHGVNSLSAGTPVSPPGN